MICNINENISSVVYHFCTIDELIALFYYDEILLSVAQRNSTDFNISKGFDYYSFTRQRSNKIGYAYKQLHKGVDMYVRITFDGDIFNCSYKGHAIDYFYMMDGDNKLGDEIYSLYGNDCIVKKISTESEDRLFSNRPIIYNASKYIKRVDILIKNIRSEDDNTFNKLKYLFSHKNHNKVFVFFDENNYNAYSPEKMLDDNNIVKMFDDYKRASGIINVNYSTQQCHVVACIIKCILYGETYNNDILQKLLAEYEFNDKIINQIINEHNKISDVYNILVNFRKYLRNTKLLFNGVQHKVGLLSFSILLDYLHKKQITLEEFIYKKKLLLLCKK